MYPRAWLRRVGVTTVALAATLLAAAPAGADTQVVNFDDQSQNTTVSNQYPAVHFVTSNGALQPVVKSAPSKAHSDGNVAIWTCEFLGECSSSSPHVRGILTDSASSISAYAGFYSYSPPGSGATADVRLLAYNASDE